MKRNYAEELYKVWAHDNQVYGPIDLALLIQWVEESRVFRDSWVHLQSRNEWRMAKKTNDLSALVGHGYPDLELIFTGSKKYRFAVECKWQKGFKEGKIEWAKKK